VTEDDSLSPFGAVLAEKLLSETREELGRADGKAQIFLAASGVVIGVVLSGIIGGKWSPSQLDCLWQGVWWIGAAASGFGVGALAFGVYPRLKASSEERMAYFEDAAKFDLYTQLIGPINQEADGRDRDLYQLWVLSRAAHRKYRAVQVAIWSFAVAIVACLAAVLCG